MATRTRVLRTLQVSLWMADQPVSLRKDQVCAEKGIIVQPLQSRHNQLGERSAIGTLPAAAGSQRWAFGTSNVNSCQLMSSRAATGRVTTESVPTSPAFDALASTGPTSWLWRPSVSAIFAMGNMTCVAPRESPSPDQALMSGACSFL